jgi:type 1 fimbria pilin
MDEFSYRRVNTLETQRHENHGSEIERPADFLTSQFCLLRAILRNNKQWKVQKMETLKMKSRLNKTLITKSLLAVSLAALLPMAGTAMAAEIAGGTINFSGSVVTSACAIGSSSSNVDVNLGQVRTASLVAAGSEASTAKSFSVVVEDCDTTVSTGVALTFSGTPDAKDPGSLAVGSNGGAGTAQNVAIRFYDEQGTVVKLGEASSITTLRNGVNTLNFSAKYYSPAGQATAGDASAVATYTLTYS